MDKSQIHDLSMLYLQQQGISNLSPEDLYVEYKEVYNEIYTLWVRENPRLLK